MQDESPAVRRAVVLAYRKLRSADMMLLLDDRDPTIVTEAVRAIHDVPIDAALPAFAKLIDRKNLSEVEGYRILNAHYRLGKKENADALAQFAAREGERDSLRREALHLLDEWDRAPRRDRVLGIYRPVYTRPSADAIAAMRLHLNAIFQGPDSLRSEAARIAGRFGIKEAGEQLFALATNAKSTSTVRIESLVALERIKDARLGEAVNLALKDGGPRLRASARKLLVGVDLAKGLASLEQALEKGTIFEQQQAFAALGDVKGEQTATLLQQSLTRLREGKVEAGAQLELVEVAERHTASSVKRALAEYEAARKKDEPFGQYRHSLWGGDRRAGRDIFRKKAELSCLRCHKAEGEGTGEVGPDLSDTGAKQTREYLLESIVLPNKQIAKGYETVEVVLLSGQVRSGILKSETASELRLMSPEGALIIVAKDQIEERRTGKSAMPDDLLKHLSRREMRDLVEYLASLKTPPRKTEPRTK
jgi:quinoprotein glucose dehydrogenase